MNSWKWVDLSQCGKSSRIQTLMAGRFAVMSLIIHVNHSSWTCIHVRSVAISFVVVYSLGC